MGRPVERSCGPCSACCTELGILGAGPPGTDGLPTLKPERTRCPHETPDSARPRRAREGCGCSAYADRPAGCRTYRCLYVTGEVHDNPQRDFRPDRLGVIFDREAEGAVVARELRPGAADDVAVRYLLGKFAAVGVVALLRADGRREVLGEGSRRVRLEVAPCP